MTVLNVAFGFVLFSTFLLVLTLTSPSKVERKISERLAGIRITDSLPSLGEASAEILKRTHLSRIPWLNHLLQGWRRAHNLRRLLEQAHSRHSVGTILSAAGVGALAVFLVAHRFLPVLLLDLVLASLAAAAPFALLGMQKARYLARFDRALPDAIDIVARSLRAGHSLSAAIEIVSEQAAEPVCSEFGTLHKQQNFGLPFREALLALVRQLPSADLRFFLTAMLVQKETGGNLVEILERTNVVIRERIRLEGEVRIYTAQGRLSGWILGLLPVGMFLLITLVNPGYARILVDDPVGQKMVGVGVIQILIGVALIRKIVRVKV